MQENLQNKPNYTKAGQHNQETTMCMTTNVSKDHWLNHRCHSGNIILHKVDGYMLPQVKACKQPTLRKLHGQSNI